MNIIFLDLYKGLQEEHIIPIIRILNGLLGFYHSNYNRDETPEELINRINEYYNPVNNCKKILIK